MDIILELKEMENGTMFCWSDMTDEERDEQMTNRSEEWLKSLCKGLGNVIHKIGEDLDIACE